MLASTTVATDLEHVVLLDERGGVAGTAAKAAAHTVATPLHLAFSCHLVAADGRVLLTRRALTKRTWPGVWTNGCCGHPQLGETLREAIERRVREELGLDVVRTALVLPDFAYRAEMPDGTVEHELCPVVIAEVAGLPSPDPGEVDDLVWLRWDEVVDRSEREPWSLSPWSVEQVGLLATRGGEPLAWLDEPTVALTAPLLDRRVRVAEPGPAPVPTGDGALVVAQGPRRAAAPAGDGALAAVQGSLRATLDGFLTAKAAETVALAPVLAEVTNEIRALVAAGGKRLRPAFVYWGHRATGAEHDDAVQRPAAAVELLHTFALLHDDVMDRSATRRGRPSAHAALARAHERQHRLGEADWFGCSAAILAGDLTYVWADELFDSTTMPADAVARARRVFGDLRREVIAGQYLDLVLAADEQAAEEGARQVALLKSARYTVTRPLLLGAALAPEVDGARVEGALRAYGDAVGMAFQMRDDVLGLFGDPAETGKSTLDDLREGKRTLLVLRALRLADPSQRAHLRACLGDATLDEGQADEARRIVAATGALASVEALIEAHRTAAIAALAAVPDPARAALTELADLAIRRAA